MVLSRLTRKTQKSFSNDKNEILISCKLCNEPILGASFVKKVKEKKLSIRERVVLSQMKSSAKLNQKLAKLSGLDERKFALTGTDSDIWCSILGFHFQRNMRNKEHKQVLDKILESGNADIILDYVNIDYLLMEKYEVVL